ncbi:class I SAM-dependent methyltransferase [Paratractidigestivibacter sp.]|uniref:class I SAM-dependent methyltransferase n=1 Tax=Paratractidigestivibacter sp. TaxID=2847316 RepID=UPI002ABD9307|nr:methyltransferase domain-containing protein [Paratractidigestivibacter sp.]
MARTAEELKQMSVREFTEAARVYESGYAGIYEMCKDDYPQMLAELEGEPFADVLDVGCGTGAVIELLHQKFPEARYTGLDLTPAMIDAAAAKELSNCEFVVGDAENLPFADASFDAVLSSNSFHHYPNPGAFFAGALRVLRPGGRLILRDYTSSDFVVWLMNTFELPFVRLLGHGDVRVHKVSEFREMADAAGFEVEKLEAQKGFRAHLVARKPR